MFLFEKLIASLIIFSAAKDTLNIIVPLYTGEGGLSDQNNLTPLN